MATNKIVMLHMWNVRKKAKQFPIWGSYSENVNECKISRMVQLV